MKRFKQKAVCAALAATMMLGAASCSKNDPGTDGSKESSESTGIETQEISDTLTYPDHIASAEEIHPGHEPGTITGEDASDLLDDIELRVLSKSLNNYVDITTLLDHPENYGLKTDEVSWGHITTSPDTEHIDGILSDLYSIDYESLDHDDRIFYDKILFDYEEQKYASQFTAFEYYDSILNPFTSVQANLLFVLDVIDIKTVEDAENYITLVKDIDRYFDEILDFEEERASLGFASTDDIYESIAVSFDNLYSQKDDCFLYESFINKIGCIPGITDDEKARLISEEEDAMKNYMFPEFEECASRLRDLKGSGGKDGGVCRFPGGDAYFAQKVRALSNSSKPIEELMSDADNAMADIKAEARGYASDVLGDEAVKDHYINHFYGSEDPEENLNDLKEIIKADFPEIHEHSYYLLEVPAALKDNFSPAAYLGYHLDSYDSNLIITNTATITGNFGTLCAHEGYPGHMYQSVYTRSKTQHPYMYLTGCIGYKEGWAVYCEQYSYRFFDDNEAVRNMCKCDAMFSIVLGAIADYGVNYKGWTASDLADYYSKLQGTKITADQVSGLYNIVRADPGYGVKYGSGYIRTKSIIDNAFANHPDKSASEIHAAYLNGLTGTFEQIEENMEKELAS